jgi:Tfp pilus assembly protein PilO
MKNSNNKVKKSLYYVLPVIAILVVIGIGIGFIQPKIVEIQDLQQKKASEVARKQKLEAKLSQLSNLDGKRSDLLAQLQAVTVALPDQKEVPQLIIQLQNIAKESDIEIQSIQMTPGKLVETGSALATKVGPDINFILGYKGSYESIRTFLGKIYKAKRLINMDSLNISVSSNETEAGQITVQSQMFAYYQPRPAIPKDPTEELPTISTPDQAIYDQLQGYTSYAGASTNQ